MIFQSGWEPILIQGIVIGFEATLENTFLSGYQNNLQAVLEAVQNSCNSDLKKYLLVEQDQVNLK